MELYLTEIILSDSHMFVVCLVSVWQRNFETMVCVCVCVYGETGWELVHSQNNLIYLFPRCNIIWNNSVGQSVVH